MKRVILMLVMMFTMGVYSFAENNNTVAVENVAKYDLKLITDVWQFIWILLQIRWMQLQQFQMNLVMN